jgi:4-hydroxybenzoate polyprenyltransferase
VFKLFGALRPRQWPKNLLLFSGVVFGGKLLHPTSLLRSVEAFGAFCLFSSAVYLTNDVIDRDVDRYHPAKASRAVATGALSVGAALMAAGVLIGTGLTVAAELGLAFAAIAIAYIVLMGLYVTCLKHVFLIDTLVIATGFVLRAWGGAAAVDVPPSRWLLILTLLLATFLSLSKRRAEIFILTHAAADHRPSLSRYRLAVLDRAIAFVTVATATAYLLYTISPETIARFGTNKLALTVPLPVVGLTRYSNQVYKGAGGDDPSEHLLSDAPLLVCVAVWAISVILIIYVFR